ncbi:hypothetical protein [Microtetraspora fusca]|nr:hypothetical protein [Microtetraspora fusca]
MSAGQGGRGLEQPLLLGRPLVVRGAGGGDLLLVLLGPNVPRTGAWT